MIRILICLLISLVFMGCGGKEKVEMVEKEGRIPIEKAKPEVKGKVKFTPKNNILSEEQVKKYIEVQKKLAGQEKSSPKGEKIGEKLTAIREYGESTEKAFKKVGLSLDEFLWIDEQIMKAKAELKMAEIGIGSSGEEVPEKNLELIKKYKNQL